MMKKKLGLLGEKDKDEKLIIELLSWMHKNKADYTNTFCFLMDEYKEKNKIYNEDQFILWKKQWENRIKLNNQSQLKTFKTMKEANPLIIPRNHLVEKSLKHAVEHEDLSKIHELLKVLQNPLECDSNISFYQSVPLSDKNYVTYCGT